MREVKRCSWATSDILLRYHDQEWGVPLHDGRMLFEFLCLEGAQAGLSWETILKKRENYRKAFDNFQPEIVAKYNRKKINEFIVRFGNRAQSNEACIRGSEREGVFIDPERVRQLRQNVWHFASDKNDKASRRSRDVRARSNESDRMSKDLRKRGFSFVGSTICYAFMQAVRIVNDHTRKCFRRTQVATLD
jgi:DNA-3-methyladenine glycosylase I